MRLPTNPDQKEKMITKIILRFEDLEQEQQHRVLDWLANCEEKKETKFKLFLHKGGVQNKMVEIEPEDLC